MDKTEGNVGDTGCV